MAFKILTEEWKRRLVAVLAPRFLGRDQDHLLHFADTVADINDDHVLELLQPLQAFDSDLQSPNGASMIGITDAENYYGGTSNVEDALQQVGVLLDTVAGVDLSGLAPTDSPAFTGNPTAPTPALADNDTSIATTAFVKGQNYIDATSLGGFAPIESPAFTGNPTAPTALTGDDSTSIANTEWVKNQNYITGPIVAATYAPLASPVFTGNPQAPTPATADNDTTIATTAFVKAQGYITNTNVAHLSGTETFTGDKHFNINTTFSEGMTVGDHLVASPHDVTRHLQLHSGGGGYGMSITGGMLNITAGASGGVAIYPNGSSSHLLGITAAGVAHYDGMELGFRNLIRTGALAEGMMCATTTGVTMPTGQPVGATFYIYNNTSGSVPINQGASMTLRLAGTNTTGGRTLAPRGFAMVWYNTASEAICSGDVT